VLAKRDYRYYSRPAVVVVIGGSVQYFVVGNYKCTSYITRRGILRDRFTLNVREGSTYYYYYYYGTIIMWGCVSYATLCRHADRIVWYDDLTKLTILTSPIQEVPVIRIFSVSHARREIYQRHPGKQNQKTHTWSTNVSWNYKFSFHFVVFNLTLFMLYVQGLTFKTLFVTCSAINVFP